MNSPDAFHVANLALIESLYADYCADPQSVDDAWRAYFADWANPTSHAPVFAAKSLFRRATAGSDAENIGSIAAKTIGVGIENVAPQNMQAVAGVHLFADLPKDVVKAIASTVCEVRCVDGEQLIARGAAARAMFIVMAGAVRVVRDGRMVARLGAGEVVGEMAILHRSRRSADVFADGADVVLLRLASEDLDRLMGAEPKLARGLIQLVARRLQDNGQRQESVDHLIRAYRVRGHVVANLDPLGRRPTSHPELELSYHGLSEGDLDRTFSSRTLSAHGGGLVAAKSDSVGKSPENGRLLRDIVQTLQNTYCRSIGVQYMHIDDLWLTAWLQERMEGSQNSLPLSRAQQLRILTKLTDAETFERFVHKAFVGAKRFSLEGAETLIPLLDQAIEDAADRGVCQVVIGMPHRGRLNVLANVMGKSPQAIFEEFQDNRPESHLGRGDVKYHLGFSSDRVTDAGNKVHLSLCFNPSHLEFVSPVVMGRVRGKQERLKDREGKRVLGIVIHGDAAFSGQGVVQECFNMSQLPGYSSGGTIHIVVNNQIGFTTSPEEARSSQYATDVARMLEIPIFHVNGEDPEGVAQVIRLAMEFRETFGRDVVIDMYCYRRHGHNEGDEPAFTQPVMYRWIRARESVREAYVRNLTGLGEVSQAEAEEIAQKAHARLETELKHAQAGDVLQMPQVPKEVWEGYVGGIDRHVPEVATGLELSQIAALLRVQTLHPEGFHLNSKVKRLDGQRLDMAQGKRGLDWGAAESLAFASLIAEGRRVRLSGQDSGRGTFSHRHATRYDSQTGALHTPLAHVGAQLESVCQGMVQEDAALASSLKSVPEWSKDGVFEVFNSPLSETAVLGFDYGFSLDWPDALVIWEAQFGDFANGAQVIIDQFLSSGEDKWERYSGIVMLLPHGFEGQGPEHSSARLERYLQMAAEDNIRVVYPTTPAQIFHLLRRQMHRKVRKPLVVMSPKSLLRHPEAVSPLSDLQTGSGFLRVIDDPQKKAPKAVRMVLLCTGKVFYDLDAHRREEKIEDVALVRIEELYPFPEPELAKALQAYPSEVEVRWVQEEPLNMGAWPFLRARLGEHLLGRKLEGVGRPASASPATGSGAAHRFEQQRLMQEAYALQEPRLQEPKLQEPKAAKSSASKRNKSSSKKVIRKPRTPPAS